MADDVIDLIKSEHRLIEKLLDGLDPEQPEATSTLERVRDLLVPHSEAEESFVYPTIGEKDSKEGEEVKDGVAEHHHIEGMLRDLLAQEPGSPGYDGTLAALKGELTHHVQEEEEELLPALAEHTSKEEREQMGQRWVQETGHDVSQDGDSDSGGESEAGSGDGGASRDELYRRAQEQDIPGRSSMSKDELAEAVGDDSE